MFEQMACSLIPLFGLISFSKLQIKNLMSDLCGGSEDSLCCRRFNTSYCYLYYLPGNIYNYC